MVVGFSFRVALSDLKLVQIRSDLYINEIFIENYAFWSLSDFVELYNFFPTHPNVHTLWMWVRVFVWVCGRVVLTRVNHCQCHQKVAGHSMFSTRPSAYVRSYTGSYIRNHGHKVWIRVHKPCHWYWLKSEFTSSSYMLWEFFSASV